MQQSFLQTPILRSFWWHYSETNSHYAAQGGLKYTIPLPRLFPRGLRRPSTGLPSSCRMYLLLVMDTFVLHFCFDTPQVPGSSNSSRQHYSESQLTGLLCNFSSHPKDTNKPIKNSRAWWPALSIPGNPEAETGRGVQSQFDLHSKPKWEARKEEGKEGEKIGEGEEEKAALRGKTPVSFPGTFILQVRYCPSPEQTINYPSGFPIISVIQDLI